MKLRNLSSGGIIIAIFVVVNLILHLIADYYSGFHGDELLHIEAGRHPAFGYMDFPPVIAVLAFFQNLFHSDSIYINHLFVHLATALIFIFCGLITIELGGKKTAVVLTLSCIMFAPGLGASHSLFLPVIFEQLAWVICIWFVIKYCNNPSGKFLIWLAFFSAAGFLSKYSTAFLIAGLILSAMVFNREILNKKSLWISILLFLILILPNLIWQISKGMPVLHHMSKLYETQLDNRTQADNMKSLLLFLNPLSAFVWISGLLIAPFLLSARKFRLASAGLLFTFILLFFSKGKEYYYFPLILCVFPFGSVIIEKLFVSKRWIIYPYLTLLLISGLYLMPVGMPVLPLEKYISIYHLKKNGSKRIPLNFENYYSSGIWTKILAKTDSTYKSLPAEERKKCLIWGRHYSQSGGVNLMGKRIGLPQAFSFHSSCYNWVPEFSNDITVIVISDFSWNKDHWLRYFGEVELIDDIQNNYAADDEWYIQHIYLCRKPFYSSTELKQMFSEEVF